MVIIWLPQSIHCFRTAHRGLRSQLFCGKTVLRYFVKFRKNACTFVDLFSKIVGLALKFEAKKRMSSQMFSCNFQKHFQISKFTENLRVSAFLFRYSKLIWETLTNYKNWAKYKTTLRFPDVQFSIDFLLCRYKHEC